MSGRPSSFTDEIAAVICERIAAGQSLREICRDEAMPDRETVRRWLRGNEQFRGHYAQAREEQADHFADEIAEIADDGSNDWMERRRQDGSIETVLNHEHVSRSKLRIDTRKWLMSKMAPKRYGDRTEISGPGGGPIQTEDVTPLERARLIAFALEKGARAAAQGKAEG